MKYMLLKVIYIIIYIYIAYIFKLKIDILLNLDIVCGLKM